MAFRVGQRIGGYEFLRILNSSGTTIVYEVYNETAGRREAMKLLPKEMKGDTRAVERFLREAKIRSSLSHPNIATFYRGFELEGELVMTLETIDSCTLESRLEEGPLTMTESIDIVLQILEALVHAHAADVVHRELCPSSIFLSAAGHAKLSGFTLARQSSDPKLTQPGLVSGPVHYLSPEQVKGLGEVDGRSDVYSMGILLFEMVTGSKPFDSRSQFDIMQAHVMSPPPEPSDLREDVPLELGAVILKALEKFPHERYRSAEEFREALTRVRAKVIDLETREKAFAVRPPMENLDDDIGQEAARIRLPMVQRRSGRARAAVAARGPLSGPDWDDAEDDSLDVGPDFETAASAGGSAAMAMSRPSASTWRARDLLMVGFLTFVMVVAAVLAVVFVFDA
jgi:serine/threonine protein kinase